MMTKQFETVPKIALLLACCFSGCTYWPAECEEFFMKQTVEQAEAKFQTYPVEKQFDLYLCGMKVHPPRIGLAWYIADGGEKIVPFLFETLKAEKNEYNQSSIIFIFEQLSVKGHLRDRRDVVNEIRKVVAAMKPGGAKELARQSLNNIEKNISN